MKRITLAALSYLLCISLFPIMLPESNLVEGRLSDSYITKADEFLAYHLYNPQYGLLPEADDIPVYWVTCDNMLAQCALKDFVPTISANISATIKQYAINYSLPVDANGIPISYKHEVLLGETIPTAANDSYPFWQWVHYNLTVPSWSYQNLTNNPPIVVVADIQNDTHLTTDWMQYEDLVLYRAMDYFYLGRYDDAVNLFNSASSMWDGTGINDKAYRDTLSTVSQYQIYKLILLCYTRRLLALPPLSFESAMITKILSAQRPDGGIRTGYAPGGEFNSDANTETTAMFVILGPYNVRPLSMGIFAFYYPWYGTSNVSAYWHHWNDFNHNPDNVTEGRRDIAATDYPLHDVYDSNNETVIDQQIKEAKDAGINCFVISWWGINDFTDDASKHIKNVCERDDFKFTFYVENTSEHYNTTPSINQTVNDITYLLNTYGNSSSFCKIDGRPVIFVYAKARDNLNSEAWIWHACTNSSGIDSDLGTNESASTQWRLSEDVRKPPRFGIIPFQPFKTMPGYVESASPIPLQPNEQYWLNVGVSDIGNDSGNLSQVGVEVKIGTDPTCNDTLYNQTLHFSDGWQDLSFNITAYAGQDVCLRVESYAVGWSSEWAAVDYFYITNSSGKIVSADPFFDNGWNETIYQIRAEGYTPYVIMDFGGYEGKLEDFIDYFSNCIDGMHVYNPTWDNESPPKDPAAVSSIYDNASELAHSSNLAFIATVLPGFDNSHITNNSITVNRSNGAYYTSFWQVAKACSPDGYAITSFNEWHECTEIEPSKEYENQYLSWTFIEFLTIHFNNKPSSPNWNPMADVNTDGVVNMRDIALAIHNFNQHE